MNFAELFDLQPHGADVYVGVGPRYPWGGLYGGQIVAQALRAAAATVDPALSPHSLRAYFIRRGEHTEPIRFEVDRIRNGRSFATRRVVARQSVGVVLNLETSFQSHEHSDDLQPLQLDRSLPLPDSLASDAWTDAFDRHMVDPRSLNSTTSPGRLAVWMRTQHSLPDEQLLHQCWLAYMSDDIPLGSIHVAHPEFSQHVETERYTMAASLDHSIWFHRPFRADEWHLYDVSTVSFQNARGLTLGNVFSLDGTHVATFAQEGLVRRARQPQD